MDPSEAVFGIISVAAFFITIACISVAFIISNLKKRKLLIETYKMAIEKGQPVPQLKVARSPFNSLRSGLVWLGAGLGLLIAFGSAGKYDVIGLSAIPIFIGIALIISHYIEKKNTKAVNTNGE